ncbi:hypothetical protein Golomagni_07670, partial [Golovinomyces magnicellulatus]
CLLLAGYTRNTSPIGKISLSGQLCQGYTGSSKADVQTSIQSPALPGKRNPSDTFGCKPLSRLSYVSYVCNTTARYHASNTWATVIEGHGNVILYTGDLRCEPWHINSLAREPTILEYTSGIKRLDRIYLDTSFISDVPFQTKSEGITQLLRSVAKYPKDTVFHLHAWTFGYEEVWLALSKALNSKIHVDSYKLNIYRSLVKSAKTSTGSLESFLTPQAAALAGYQCGNAWHEGCLTSDTNVRLHSCEKGNMCEIAKNTKVVNIMPIVARLPEGDIREHGVGGGGDDLERVAELEFLSPGDMQALKAVYDNNTL